MYTIQNGLILLTGIYIVLINNFKNNLGILNNNIFKIIILLIIVLISKNNISLGLLLFVAYILSLFNTYKIEKFGEEATNDTSTTEPKLDDTTTTEPILDDTPFTTSIPNDTPFTTSIPNDTPFTTSIPNDTPFTTSIPNDTPFTTSIPNDTPFTTSIPNDTPFTTSIPNTKKLPDNEICTIDDDCLNGNCIAKYCNPTEKNLNQELNERCVANINCRKGELMCNNGICKKRLDNNYGCISDDGCANGNCISGFCNPTKTKLNQELNEICVANINCRKGELMCNNGICNKRLDNTSGCISDDGCANGNCIAGYCNPTNTNLNQGPNGKCVANKNCDNNGNCIHNTCLIPKNGNCTQTDTNYTGYCISGHCKDNKCVKTIDRNDRCNNDDRECNDYNTDTKTFSTNYECRKDGSSKRYCKIR